MNMVKTGDNVVALHGQKEECPGHLLKISQTGFPPAALLAYVEARIHSACRHLTIPRPFQPSEDCCNPSVCYVCCLWLCTFTPQSRIPPRKDSYFWSDFAPMLFGVAFLRMFLELSWEIFGVTLISWQLVFGPRVVEVPVSWAPVVFGVRIQYADVCRKPNVLCWYGLLS